MRIILGTLIGVLISAHLLPAQDSILLSIYLNWSGSNPDWQIWQIDTLQLMSSEGSSLLSTRPLDPAQTARRSQIKLYGGRIPEQEYRSLRICWQETPHQQLEAPPGRLETDPDSSTSPQLVTRNYSRDFAIDGQQLKNGCLLLNLTWEPVEEGRFQSGGIILQEYTDPPLGALVFVSCEGSDCITVVDRFTGKVTDIIEVGNRPRGLAWSRSAQRLYAACAGSDQIAVIDGQDRSLITFFQLQYGDTPSRLELSVDESQLFVLNRGSGTLLVMDLHSGQEVARVVTGEGPAALAVDPLAGYVYLSEEPERRIVTFDPVTREVVSSTLTLGEPGEVLYEEFSGLCYVTHRRQPVFSGFDPRSGILKVTIDLCSPGSGLAFQQVGGLLYVAQSACAEVAIFRPEYEIELGTIRLTGKPGRLSVTPDSGQLLVCLPYDDQLAVYETGNRSLRFLIDTGRQPHTALVPR